MLGGLIGCVGYDSVCECRLSLNGHPFRESLHSQTLLCYHLYCIYVLEPILTLK